MLDRPGRGVNDVGLSPTFREGMKIAKSHSCFGKAPTVGTRTGNRGQGDRPQLQPRKLHLRVAERRQEDLPLEASGTSQASHWTVCSRFARTVCQAAHCSEKASSAASSSARFRCHSVAVAASLVDCKHSIEKMLRYCSCSSSTEPYLC